MGQDLGDHSKIERHVSFPTQSADLCLADLESMERLSSAPCKLAVNVVGSEREAR